MVRRTRILVGLSAGMVAAGLVFVSLAVALTSQPLTGRTPAGEGYRIVVEPELAAGQPGWTSSISLSLRGRMLRGEGSGGGYPTSRWPFLAADNLSVLPPQNRRGEALDYVLTGPEVAAVRVGKRTIGTFTDSRLPAGDRAAVFFRPARSPAVALPGLPPPRAIRLLPLDGAGHVISTGPPTVYPGQTPRFWQSPSALGPNNHQPRFHGPTRPLPGACELSQHGLAGLKPEFGHVINRIRTVSGSEGEVFVSCIDTEYYLHGWPLEVGILLDAVHPGQVLGPIPGAVPVADHPGTVNLAAGQFPGSLTARQIGQAWLVVQGGASLKQRLHVLRALAIRRLDVRR